MKRFSEVAGQVTAVAKREARHEVAESPKPTRNTHMCMAYGCPKAGAITDSTTGSDTWLCRWHYGKGSAVWQEITDRLRRGDEGLHPAQSPLVLEMRSLVRTSAQP